MSRVVADTVLDVHVYYLHDPRLNPTQHSHSFDAYDAFDSGDDDDPASPDSESSDSLMNEMWCCGPSLFVHDDVLNISITGSMTVKQLKDEIYMQSDYWPIHSSDCDLLLYHEQRLLYEHQVIGATSWFRKACERMENVKVQPGEIAPACGVWLLAVPIDSCACPHCSAYQSKRSHRRVKLAQRHIEEHYQSEYMYTAQHVCPGIKAGERAPLDEDDSWMDDFPSDKNKASAKQTKAKKAKKKTRTKDSSSKTNCESASKSLPSTPVIKARVNQQTFVQPVFLTPSVQPIKPQPVKPQGNKKGSSVDPDFTVVLSKKEKKAKAKLEEADHHTPSKSKSKSPYHGSSQSPNTNVPPISNNKRKPSTPVFKSATVSMSPKVNSISVPARSPKLTSLEPSKSDKNSKHSRPKPNTPLISAAISPQSSHTTSTDSFAQSLDSADSPQRSSSIDESNDYEHQSDPQPVTSSTFSPSSVSSTRSTQSQSSGESQYFSLNAQFNGKWSPLITSVNPISTGKSSPVIQPISSPLIESARCYGGAIPFSPIFPHGYTAQQPVPVGPSSLLSSSSVFSHTSSSIDDEHCAEFDGAMSAADVSKLCDDDVDHHVEAPRPAQPQRRFVHPQFSLQRAVPTSAFESSGASIQKQNYAFYHPQPQVQFSSPYGSTLMRPGVTTSGYNKQTGLQWQ